MNRNKLTWKLLSIIYYDFYNNTVTYGVTMTLLWKYYGCTTAIYRSADYYMSLQSLQSLQVSWESLIVCWGRWTQKTKDLNISKNKPRNLGLSSASLTLRWWNGKAYSDLLWKHTHDGRSKRQALIWEEGSMWLLWLWTVSHDWEVTLTVL